jgi:uncharacterized protein YjiS (DUF1127 family)
MIGSFAEQRIVFAKRIPSIRNGLKQAIANAVRAWHIAKAQRRIANQLSAFDDRMLKDIGVSRDSIYVAAYRLAAAGNEDRQA